jgi:hypothetical protein
MFAIGRPRGYGRARRTGVSMPAPTVCTVPTITGKIMTSRRQFDSARLGAAVVTAARVVAAGASSFCKYLFAALEESRRQQAERLIRRHHLIYRTDSRLAPDQSARDDANIRHAADHRAEYLVILGQIVPFKAHGGPPHRAPRRARAESVSGTPGRDAP